MAKEGTTYSLFVGATSGIGNLTIQFDLINDDCETPTVIDAESVTFYGSSQLDLKLAGGRGANWGFLWAGTASLPLRASCGRVLLNRHHHQCDPLWFFCTRLRREF